MKRIIYIIGVLLTFCAIYYADAIPPSPSSPPSGSTSITTLGTVTTGTWNATKIGISYGGTNATNATDARTELGLGSLATQNADNATITGGTIDGTTIGGTTPAPGSFTEISANVIKTAVSADATLSGTPIIITVYDAASNTPYYFKAYPTK